MMMMHTPVVAQPAHLPLSRADLAELLARHTRMTGQRFLGEAIERIHYLCAGHPWLVHALSDQIVNRDVTDCTVAVTAAHVEAAKETLIVQRRTHIDSLGKKLLTDPVRRVIEPMLVGAPLRDKKAGKRDLSPLLELGLLIERDGQPEIANPIYKEIVPRELCHLQQHGIVHQPAWYVRPDGSLDMPKLMAGWQAFWRDPGRLLAADQPYREAAPQLLLSAFVQRIVDGTGRIERDYGRGRGALDLLILWNNERHAIAAMQRRDIESEADGVHQLISFLEQTGPWEGWLVLFDLRTGRGPSKEARMYMKKRRRGPYTIWVVGC